MFHNRLAIEKKWVSDVAIGGTWRLLVYIALHQEEVYHFSPLAEKF
jgi:hypothetical protein